MIQIIKDRCIWDEIVSSFPCKLQDIYFTYKYFEMNKTIEQGEVEAFYYSEDEKMLFYPYLKNTIEGYDLEEEYYDIHTPYGYGGPISNTSNTSFLKNSEMCFQEYCTKSNIVCEFIRFHPILKNHNLLNSNIKISQNRKTVLVDLTKSIEEIWSDSISSKNRNVIRKAEKSGLKVIKLNSLETFIRIYTETMQRINSEEFYMFNDAYFNSMFEDEAYTFLGVLLEEKIIACGIFMKQGEYLHYHLAGSIREYLNLGPNNLMLYEAIKMGKQMGASMMLLGGGLKNSDEDSLFKFKASFSKETSDFYIGERILNKGIYSYLIKRWELNNGKQSSMLQQYRY